MIRRFLKPITLFTISCLFIVNVAAEDVATGVDYVENPFTDDLCVEDTSWTETATNDYKLNAETGKFELTGTSYNESSTTSQIFYITSDSGKTLFAYVPNYKTVVQDATTKALLSDKGIITTSSCENILRVTKTVVGGDYEQDDTSSVESNTTVAVPIDNGENEIEEDDPDDVIDSTVKIPDTGSNAGILSVIGGVTLLAVGGYTLFTAKKKQPKKEQDKQGGR